jgi:hypothetical protein
VSHHGAKLGVAWRDFWRVGDRHGGRGSPARSSSEGRARERERADAKWDGKASAGAGGAQKGARVRGRATWPGISACVLECTCAGPQRVAGKAELTGVPRRSKRERARGKWFGVLTRRAREAERERDAWTRATGAHKEAPLGRGRGGGSAC